MTDPYAHLRKYGWKRTCQECDHEDHYKPVVDYKDDKWKDIKCKRCKSDALDYGSWDVPLTDYTEDEE